MKKPAPAPPKIQDTSPNNFKRMAQRSIEDGARSGTFEQVLFRRDSGALVAVDPESLDEPGDYEIVVEGYTRARTVVLERSARTAASMSGTAEQVSAKAAGNAIAVALEAMHTNNVHLQRQLEEREQKYGTLEKVNMQLFAQVEELRDELRKSSMKNLDSEMMMELVKNGTGAIAGFFQREFLKELHSRVRPIIEAGDEGGYSEEERDVIIRLLNDKKLGMFAADNPVTAFIGSQQATEH